MYVKKKIISTVMDLFAGDVALRDDRWATIKLVTEKLRKEESFLTEWDIIKLAFDVDRAFRYVQQHVPQLRGEKWLERQKKGGEIDNDDYLNKKEHLDYIAEISKTKNLQIQLFTNEND